MLATLLGVIPKARRQGLRLLVTPDTILRWHRDIGPGAKTLIDVNEQYLAAAQDALHTETKKDTVNTALREVAALAAQRHDLRRLTSGGLPDLEDDDVMRAAWRQ